MNDEILMAEEHTLEELALEALDLGDREGCFHRVQQRCEVLLAILHHHENAAMSTK